MTNARPTRYDEHSGKTKAAEAKRMANATVAAIEKRVLDTVYTPDGKALPRDEVERLLRGRDEAERDLPEPDFIPNFLDPGRPTGC